MLSLFSNRMLKVVKYVSNSDQYVEGHKTNVQNGKKELFNSHREGYVDQAHDRGVGLNGPTARHGQTIRDTGFL